MIKEPCSPHGWTLDTLEKFLSTKVESLKDNVSLALANADKALTKAESALDKRLDSMNELRGVINDQANKLLSRAEWQVQNAALVEKIDNALTRIASIESGTSGKSAGLGLAGSIVLGLVSVIGAFVGIVSVIVLVLHR